MQISRQTYSLLDWFGDWGGLDGALRFIVSIIVSPVSAFALKSKLAEDLVHHDQRTKRSPANRQERQTFVTAMQSDVKGVQKIKTRNFLFASFEWFSCCLCGQRKRTSRIVNDSADAIDK